MNRLLKQINMTTSAITSSPLVGNNLTQDDFLRLLTVQLQNQDPMEPMKDTEFVSQLANFTALQQTTDMSKTLALLAGTMQQTGSVAYLGKEVTLKDDKGQEVKGIVTQVGIDDDMAYVMVNGKKYNAFSITSVNNPTTPTTPTTNPPVVTTVPSTKTTEKAVDTTTPIP